MPLLIGRVDQGYRVRPEVAKLPRPPSEYLHRFTYDTIVHSKAAMEFIIQEVGAERIMVGSDFCYEMGYDRPLEFLDQIDLTTAQRKMILSENASRVLNL